jgi:membrane-associated phospholipid phosphatase
MKKEILLSASLLFIVEAFAQNDTAIANTDSSLKTSQTSVQQSFAANPDGNPTKVYKLKPAVDIPVTAVGVGWSLYAFSKIYSKDKSSVETIQALDKNDVAGINRFGVDLYSPKALDASNGFFYASMPFPIVLMLDKHIRHDAGKVTVLWAESMAVTGLLYTGAVYFHDKFRPYAYNPEVPMDRRTRGGAKNSFFAGHVALVGTSTFFTAKVFADYHPDSRIKWVFYSIAGIATGTTGYLRIKAGEHFLTDVMIGTAVGTLSGLLVPHFHKVKNVNSRIGVTPYFGGRDNGVLLTYKL